MEVDDALENANEAVEIVIFHDCPKKNLNQTFFISPEKIPAMKRYFNTYTGQIHNYDNLTSLHITIAPACKYPYYFPWV